MPQLNPEFWVSQVFWLTLTFGTLYVVLSKLILPKISANLEARKSEILENIEDAENQARKKILKDISLKKESLDKELNEEIRKAEFEIEELKNKAPEKINKIAIEISKDLIQQLISVEVNNSSISAIVSDLSKKDKEKYYGY